MHGPEPTDPAGGAPSPPSGSAIRIYLLPNLMTAGNLFCGFLAITCIVQADPQAGDYVQQIHKSLLFILLACAFDVLDGRVARLGGLESPFGREFDSLADIVSFGVAPAFLVHRIVPTDVFFGSPQIGVFVAAIYLICGAMRLARYNCLHSDPVAGASKEFLGFPIPAAAGLVASLTLLLLWIEEEAFPIAPWRYVLPVILLFLSVMMVSEVRYPSFRSLSFRTRSTFLGSIVVFLGFGLILVLQDKILPLALSLAFTAYLVWGFARLWLPGRARKLIEQEDGEAPDG